MECYIEQKSLYQIMGTQIILSQIYADEIVIIDISENTKNKKLFLNAVSKISNNCFTNYWVEKSQI